MNNEQKKQWLRWCIGIVSGIMVGTVAAVWSVGIDVLFAVQASSAIALFWCIVIGLVIRSSVIDNNDALIDAGNDMYRLVVETRDSILWTNATADGKFEDKESEEWYNEHAEVAAAWKAAVEEQER